MTALTSAALRDGALYPLLDAIGADDHERALIHRPETPEADSLVELLALAGDVIEKLAEVSARIAEANGVALDSQRVAAGFADRIATHLADAERNGASTTISGKRLVLLLRPHLRSGNRTELHRIFTFVEPDVLFRKVVTHNLGQRLTQTLRAEHKAWAGR